MEFSNMLFVFVFFTANLLSQVLLNTIKQKNIAMLIFSLVFCCWAGLKFVVLLLAMTGLCYIGTLFIVYRAGQKKIFLIITVTLCLAVIGTVRFFDSSVGTVFALPMAMSLYTLRLLSYVVDVYRGEANVQSKYWMLLLYAAMFHLNVAGPIVRYRDMEKELVRRRATGADISNGISRFTIGLAKGAILANGCAAIANYFFAVPSAELAAIPMVGVLLGCVANMLQIYFLFSSCSDMAIGMGLMCGFHYKENFRYPYLADSFAVFWERWHISLSEFSRDYVYIPLGGERGGLLRKSMVLLCTALLFAVWYGAGWNFILLGFCFAVFYLLERFVLQAHLYKLPKTLKHVFLLLLVLVGWLLLRFGDLSAFGTVLGGLFGLNGAGFANEAVWLVLKQNLFFLLFAIAAVTPIGQSIRRYMHGRAQRGGIFFMIEAVWEIVHPVLFLLLSAMALVGNVSLFAF